jgi:hypothetical protein
VDAKSLQALLAARLPPALAADLVSQFLQIRQDVASKTLSRSAPGKFVESMVQALQHLERGAHDSHPSVDDYLKNLESRSSGLSDGLRICASCVARAMYTLRNKRNILHKGEVDPNEFDLRFLFSGAQWLMAELVRQFSGTTMQQAGALIEQIQTPVGALVEDIGIKRLVHGKLSAKDEILVLLHSHYPNGVRLPVIVSSMDRRSSDAVKKAVRELWAAKLVEGSATTDYRLTAPGLKRAMAVIYQATV